MTLNTRVAVNEPVPLQELFMECRRLIGAEGAQWRWKDCDSWNEDGSRMLMMEVGQGLPGWLIINYRPDGPLRANDNEPYKWEEEEDEPSQRPRCAYEVSLDTAYGYRGPGGETCSVLHARFIKQLAEWLTDRNCGLRWYNEFAGTWHHLDDTVAFAEFAGDGIKAMDWFQSTALPAIQAFGGGVQ